MFDVPAATAPIRPGLRMLATDGLLLLHTPPSVTHDSVNDPPTHARRDPVIAAGDAFTVTTTDVWQLNGVVANIVVVPGVIPVTSPDPDTVPTAGVELLHTMGEVVHVRVVVLPVHTEYVPVIGAGVAFTVITAVTKQPYVFVQVIVDVPAARPEATPVATSMDAVAGTELLHVAVGLDVVSVDVPETHILNVPVIGPGSGFTVTVAIATQPVGNV